VVLDWRAPRVSGAVLGGACLGLSGAIFQSLTRNPLGSPDIIGFNTGAYTGALVALLVFSTGATGGSIGALVGGLVAAFAVAALASKGGLQGYRLIVVGVAISSVLAAVNTYLILRSDLETAIAAATWGMGSFNLVGWAQVVPILIVLVVLCPVLAGTSRSLRLLELGDDAAAGLGVRVGGTRIVLLVLGVAFTAVVTAAAGPILFVALAAPQVAHRLTRSAGVPLLASALLGAFLLLGADVLAQRLLAPTQLPVGTITVTLGGLYLIGLLVVRARKAAA
jgi:iron complex transport system permease protein